jgi:hypothetical protein
MFRREPHTRSRTGCLTCRRRRKKCDERKPTCRNCERNNLHCDGYQNPIKWKALTSVAGRQHHNPDASTRPKPAQEPAQDTRRIDDSHGCTPPQNQVLDMENGRSSRVREAEDTEEALDAQRFVHHAGRSLFQATASANTSLSPSCFGVPEGRTETSSAGSFLLSPGPPESTQLDGNGHPQQVPPPRGSSVPSAFPFLINGIRSASDKQLLHHFTYILSPKLVLHSDPEKNPFNQVVLPMALYDEEDWGLFDLILSFSASHFLRILLASSDQEHTPESQKIEKIKWIRYGHAIRRHAKNLSSVLETRTMPPEEPPPNDDIRTNYALATTMLLCQWSTCEGGDQSLWRLHLNASRELVRRKVEGRRGVFDSLSDTSQMLLEWFFFHDVISSITFPTSPCCIDRHGETVEARGQSFSAEALSCIFSRRSVSEILWIGTNDGLLAIITRTLALRQTAGEFSPISSHDSPCDTAPQLDDSTVGTARGTSVSVNESGSSVDNTTTNLSLGIPDLRHSRRLSNPLFGKSPNTFDLNHFFEALAIEDTLQEWSFNYVTTQQQSVGASYHCAAYILLHFTVYPLCPLDDPKVQSFVESLVQNLCSISETDNAQTCSLLPLFICGVTARKSKDRHLVIQKAHAYSRWSGMGYIDDVIGFLIDWWEEQDRIPTATSKDPSMELSDASSYCRSSTSSWWAWQGFMRKRKLQLILV